MQFFVTFVTGKKKLFLLKKGCRNSVVDPNTVTSNLDPDPGFWPNLDPNLDPDLGMYPGPDSGLLYQL